MSTLPLTEAIMLEIHQSLGCPSYQTTKKNKFATGRASLDAHKIMGEEVLNAIFDALNMDPMACMDAVKNFTEFGNAYKALELNTWTFAADERQILWMLLGYFYMPGLARRAGFWSIASPLDKGMPGGSFWYLPEPRKVNDKPSLHLPVAQVVDWLLDLLGRPIEELASQRGQSIGDLEDSSAETLMRSLHNWRKETTPDPDSFKKYFPDELQVTFKGAFSLEESHSSAEQFSAALDFVARKHLTADKLRLEIPMTQAGRVEGILNGSASEDEQAVFVQSLAERYAIPSPQTIRQRLLFARMVQDGYGRLLKFLCPGVDRLCTDAQQNKLLQLFAIYKLTYNLTIDAWRNCGDQGEAEENTWFEEQLPSSDKNGLFLSILPSKRDAATCELAYLLTRCFFDMQAGAELEDHVGLDPESAMPIIKRNAQRAADIAEEICTELHVVARMKTSSSRRALQSEHRYWVISQIAQNAGISQRAKEAAIQHLRELAATPSQTVQSICLELDGFLNGERKKRPKDASVQVQALIDEAETSQGCEFWKGAILQYKAKHLLALNDFEGAGRLFKDALEAAGERNYGPLCGEVARDCLAVEVANQKLVVNNHEKYYRAMLAGGMMAECESMPTIEEAARWASAYFWDTLYKPYPGIQAEKRRASGAGRKMLEELMPLFISDDQARMQAWIKANRQMLKSSFPDVDGNSVLMLLIKMRTSYAQGLQKLPSAMMLGEQESFNAMLEHWRQFLGLLVQVAPKQLGIADIKNQTPLMLMAEAGDTEMVSIMLQAGADPDVQDWQGMTALHSAIKSSVNSCVDALLNHPCSLDKVTCVDQSPLHTASWTANQHAIQRLLKLAPELAWRRNSFGMTPLEHVEILIDEPKSLQKLAEELGKSGRRCATKHELVRIVELLEQAVPAPTV